MKGKRAIAGILLVGILATALAGCKNADVTKKEREKPVITLGSDSYPPYNYLNEDGIPTGIDVELAMPAEQPAHLNRPLLRLIFYKELFFVFKRIFATSAGDLPDSVKFDGK